MSLREVYNRHCHTARQERALLSAIGFTSTFTAARLITHSIRAGIGPFHNISAGGRHIHHSTFGIFGLLGIAYLWTYRIGVGNKMPEWESRLTASAYGVAAALTLDEFALWLDLHDDYWDKQGAQIDRRGGGVRRAAHDRGCRPRHDQRARPVSQARQQAGRARPAPPRDASPRPLDPGSRRLPRNAASQSFNACKRATAKPPREFSFVAAAAVSTTLPLFARSSRRAGVAAPGVEQ
jgi:hypothetical protein